MLLILLACTGGDTADSADKTTEVIDPDADHDGAPASVDCDDTDPDVRPAAPETCDGVDEDCNGIIDDEAIDAPLWYADADADGYGAPGDFQDVCEAPEGTVGNDDDCDDSDAASSPVGVEICGDAVDQDCDNTPDDGCTCEGAIGTASAFARLATGDDVVSVVVADLDADGLLDVTLGGGGEVATHFGALVAGSTSADPLLEGVEGWGDVLAAGDLDADGVTDLAIANPSGAGSVDLHVGGRSLVPAWATLSADVLGFGTSLGVADLNGDDDDDLLVGTQDPSAAGQFGIVQGPIAGGAVTDFDTRFAGEAVGDLAGSVLAVVGDTDGDGADDLLVGGPGYAEGDQSGRAWLITGPIDAGSFSLADAATTFVSATSGAAGSAVAGAGDLDNDGNADVLIGSPSLKSGSATMNVGAAYMFRGPVRAGEVELEDARAIIAGVGAEDACGHSLAGGGDLNHDGNADVAVGCADGGSEPKVSVFFGPLTSGTHYFTNGDAVVIGEPGFGDHVLLPPDLTGDGVDDLLALETSEEAAWLIPGAP